MASIDARKTGAVMLGDKARYVPAQALTTSHSAPTKAGSTAPKVARIVDGHELSGSEYESYRRAVLLAGMKGKHVYICENKRYGLADGRESRRYDFITY